MNEELSFEESAVRLEQITKRLESETLPLEESIGLYETALEQLSLCYSKLKDSKGKIQDINERITELQSEQ